MPNFRTDKLRKLCGVAIMIVLPLLLVVLIRPVVINAAVAPSPCVGNVCTGELTVGGQTVRYAYTEHIRPDGTLKVRLNGGVYTTGTLISHMISGLPAFVSWDKFANPTNGAVFLPNEDVNPTRTAYERLDSDGCAGCIVDQVLTVTYSGLAAGWYAFDLSVFQNGLSGTKNGLVFYVDVGAPSGFDESDTWVAIPNMDSPCADSTDNDLNYYVDCADAACGGSVGRVADGTLCEASETTCYDGFDNDADGDADCLDSSCDGLIGRTFDGALCQHENEFGVASCGDNFDNDGDGLPDCLDNSETVLGRSCWKNAGGGCPATENCGTSEDDDEDRSYDDSWDDAPTTGINCQDYDCAGNPVCPYAEHLTAAGTDADLQCFNGIDDDLDGDIDCGDDDCIGMDNGGTDPNMCFASEFDLVERYQLCNNYFNDDADAPMDCADTDCRRKFGNCGPCPVREDLTYYSCANGDDEDGDGDVDCADSDCLSSTAAVNPPGPGISGSLGYLVDAARCASEENTPGLCSDGWDNDTDGLADCADNQCAGLAQCQLTETSCSDRFDNDGDGYMDCVDSDCWGIDSCAAKSWANASCQIVPRMGPFVAFANVDPTVTGAVTVANHVNSTDTIRLIGGGTYTSITIVIGDNTDDDAVYPYSNPTCTLTGSGSAQMAFMQVPGRVAHIFNVAGETLNGFDLTFSCPTSAIPQGWRSYPISISVLKTPGATPESGDKVFNYILYENTQPIVNDIEAEGEGPPGVIVVERGGARKFRVVADDPDLGIGSSGICSCTVEIGSDSETTDSNCVTTGAISGIFYDDTVVNVQAFAEDGVHNIGNPITQSFTVNVLPRVVEPLTVRPANWYYRPFFRSDRMDMSLDVRFETATSATFPPVPTCSVWVRNRAGQVLNGPPGPTATVPATAMMNVISCVGTVTLPATTPDGEYFVTVTVTDERGYTAESNRQVIYWCDNKPRPGDAENVCSWADFDGDGVSEGLYSNLYAADFKACDNCVNTYNPSQIDRNANGVGEMCEPDQETGRCEFDREVVCDVSLEADDCDPATLPELQCCPIDGGTGLPEQCIEEWGLCLHDFDYCFEDQECGWCSNALGVKTDIGCREDKDCELAGLPGGTCPLDSGEGVCADDPSVPCRRSVECEGAQCLGSNICDQLIFPWLETYSGDIFSLKKILAPVPPPENKFNATYCITAKGSILNFSSGLGDEKGLSCGTITDPNTDYTLPKPENAYLTALGRIDLTGLLGGRYGEVFTSSPSRLAEDLDAMQPLDGRVILVEADGADVIIDRPLTIENMLGTTVRGNGTVIIRGGDLYITENLEYLIAGVDRLSSLASLGWIVLPHTDGTKGNVFIEGNVRRVVGSFFIAGEEGLDTVAPPLDESEVPLTLYGLVIARKFHLDRTLRSPDIGAEQFIYDGRAVANPPPGFEDITNSLPVIRDTP